MAFHPYLNFGGNCRQAFTRYQEVFGGELVLLTAKDVPGDEPVPEEFADLVMHAALTFDDHLLMASDSNEADFGPVQGMYVNYSTADIAEAERVFAALADGGEVAMPIAPTFWSPMFGVCTDRFGTPWMIGADAPESA
jgi:PhnB protein